MTNDSRCSCGCRFFQMSNFVVTCKDGRAFPVDAVAFVKCVACGAEYAYPAFWPKGAGKKTLMPILYGASDAAHPIKYVALENGEPMSVVDLLDKVADQVLANKDVKDGSAPPFHKADPEDLK